MFFTGVILGLVSSLALGTSDLASGLTARHIGIVRTAAAVLLVSLVLLSTLLLLAGESLPRDPKWIAWIAGVGVVRAVGYFALVRAYSLGPLAVVAPITASSSVATVLAAVVLLGDRPSPLQWVAVGIATAGAILLAITFDRRGRRAQLVGQGPVFALLAMLMLSTVVAAQQPPIQALGVLPTITLRRAVEVLVTWGVLIVLWRVAPRVLQAGRTDTTPELAIAEADHRMPQQPSLTRNQLAARFAFVGFVDTFGLGSLALALSIAPAWLFGISGSLSPVPGIAFGMLVLGERLRPAQWLGIALVVVALFLVAIG
jgi:drug/metabolite transporter (DMT)-like permease